MKDKRARMEAGWTAQDYRASMSPDGPMYGAWQNKPHRLVYDLCGEVEYLQGELRRLKVMHCCANCGHANECSMEGAEPVCWDDPE